MSIKKEPLIIYWAPMSHVNSGNGEWNLLYDDPYNRYKNLVKNKSKFADLNSFFACPAFTDKAKKTFVFKNPMKSSYKYNFSDINNTNIEVIYPNKPFLSIKSNRTECISEKPQIILPMKYLFFCEEPLLATFSAPYFDEPKYLKYGAIAPGTFDIGQWFRPYPVEITLWKNKGEFHIEEDEPLFYVEFLTDREIEIKRFKANEEIISYAESCSNAQSTIKARVSLLERYKKFNSTKMNKLVIKEIKENIL
jgi:hypothetical protein